MNQYTEKIIYHYALSDQSLASKIESDLFTSPVLQICFKYARDYVVKYHNAPSCTQIKDLLEQNGTDDSITPDTIDMLYSIIPQIEGYDKEWLYDTTVAWAEWQNFCKSLVKMNTYIKLNQGGITPENVKEMLEHAKNDFNKECMIDFADLGDTGSDFWDAASHKRTTMIRSSSGYSFIDTCLDGGYFPGALIVFAGAPKIGKSLWLQNLCAESVKKGENNAYISLELPEEMIHNRIGSNMFNIPSLEYHKYADDEIIMRERMTEFRKSCIIKPGGLIVKNFPTSTMSVVDLEAYLLKKEEELSLTGEPFKFKNVFVDYINIMRNYRNPNSENTYMKIKQLAEDLKAIGIKHNWCMITATQTNKSQYETNDMNTTQIAESSGLGATVDAMFGIIADNEMMARGEYFLKCLYDRVAPFGNMRRKYLCERKYLRIEEDCATTMEEAPSAMSQASQVTRVYEKMNTKKEEQISQDSYKGFTGIYTLAPNTLFDANLDTTMGASKEEIRNNLYSITGDGLFD